MQEQLRIHIDKCTRSGGPDDYTCKDYGKRSSVGFTVGYQLRKDAYLGCSAGTTGHYRPWVDLIDAHYVSEPHVYVNVVSATCK